MIEVLHITPSNKTSTILNTNLKCFPPTLPHHLEQARIDFAECNSHYDEKGIIYTTPYDIKRTAKYIKDTAYWRIWGRKRNERLLDISWEDWEEHQNDGPEFFKGMKIQNMHFDILEIKIPDDVLYVEWLHCQDCAMAPYFKDMQNEYSHREKPLFIFNTELSKKWMRVIGQVETRTVGKKIKVDLRW